MCGCVWGGGGGGGRGEGIQDMLCELPIDLSLAVKGHLWPNLFLDQLFSC